MPERTAISQVVQIGVESTPGTAVTAAKKMVAMSIEPSINANIDQFRPMGQKYKTLTALGKEWVVANITGRATYTELIYPLSSVIDTATITTPGGGTNTRTWTFESDESSEDSPKTFTVEQGSSVRAHKFAYGIVNELSLNFTRDGVQMGGQMLGRAITDGITLTSSGVTTLALVPILGKQVSVYLDDSAANLGNTQLTRVLQASWSIRNRYGPLWVLDASEGSWVTHVEVEPEVMCTLQLEADSTGMSLLADLRANTRRFIRIDCVGDEAESGVNYQATFDTSGEVVNVGQFSDAEGVFAVEFSFAAVYDSTWTKAFEVAITNLLTAL